MSTDSEASPHFDYNDTLLAAACSLPNELTKKTWDAFMETWFHLYVGFPDIIACDQGPQFKTK